MITIFKAGLTGLITMALGVIYSYQAFNLPRATIGSPTAPILFPIGLGIIMVICGALIFIKDIKTAKQASGGVDLGYTLKLIFYTTVISIAYALLYERVGYVISTIIFMEGMLALINDVKNWKVNTIVAVCFSVSVYLIFSKLFGIVLPPSPFWG